MNCPVCDRSLAPTLSICPSCGAMMFDSVREELQTKITSGRLTPRPEIKQEMQNEAAPASVVARVVAQMAAPSPAASRVAMHPPMRPPMSVHSVSRTAVAVGVARSQTAAAVAVAPQPLKRVETADLVTPNTSPTLVGFQSKNATLPDWRIQLQNAVQQRKGGNTGAASAEQKSAIAASPAIVETPLRAEVVRSTPAAKPEPNISDPRVASALRRINESRNAFLQPEVKKPIPVSIAVPAKPYKFDVVAKNSAAAIPIPSRPSLTPKPRLVSAPSPLRRDTNKLPPIAMRGQPIEIAETMTDAVVDQEFVSAMPAEFGEIKRIRIRADHQEIEGFDSAEVDTEDIEDLAQFSMRFGAGLFDLIIASFASLLILSPIAFTRGEWFTAAGVLTFGGVCAIVMFVYMTICVGFYGKTMGMRLFSLELVDAVENEYPSLHQAAVSSSVFILSLIFGGAGFLTVFFNEEKRAAHDLLSGTILVREF